MYVTDVVSPEAWMLFCLLLELNLWRIYQYRILQVWQLVFADISINGWVINFDENAFFDGSWQIFIFSAHDAKIVNGIIKYSFSLFITIQGLLSSVNMQLFGFLKFMETCLKHALGNGVQRTMNYHDHLLPIYTVNVMRMKYYSLI